MKFILVICLVFNVINVLNRKILNFHLDPSLNKKNYIPIRINFVHATRHIVGDLASNLPDEKFHLFMDTVGNYAKKFFQKFVSLYPLDNTTARYPTDFLFNTKLANNIDIKKYLTDNDGKIIYVKSKYNF